MDVALGNLTNVVVYKHEYDGVYTEHYKIGFRSPQGPTEWEVMVDGHGQIESVSWTWIICDAIKQNESELE